MNAVSSGDSAAAHPGEHDSQDRSGADFRNLAQIAEWGDAQAQLELGRRYESGDGLPQDYRKAVEWYQQSADQGTPAAQVALGKMYENGRAVAADPQIALRWYLKAAGQGYPGARLLYDNLDAKEGRASAQFAMGLRCEDGRDVSENLVDAAEWYRLAAAQGHTSAQLRLGMMYRLGRGVDSSVDEAIRWLTCAAEAGDQRAQYAVGNLYETEKSVCDPAVAFGWYRRSATRGHKDAARRLAHMFRQGLGVARDTEEAVKWQALAEQRSAVELDPYGGTDENWHGNPGWGGGR